MARCPWSESSLGIAERVAHEPLPAGETDRVAVGARDAGALLPAVLERVEPEVGEVRGFRVAEYPHDAALVVEAIVRG